jgi:hypothetical protein
MALIIPFLSSLERICRFSRGEFLELCGLYKYTVLFFHVLFSLLVRYTPCDHRSGNALKECTMYLAGDTI